MPLRILVDLQGAQSGSRLRGIGRYSLGLTKAIARNCGDDQLFILLNDQFAETLDSIHANFEHVLSEDRFVTFTSRGPVSAIPPENDTRRRIAEIMREYVIATLSPDVVLLTSLFEGVHDNAVTSIGNFASTVPTAVVLYDLIPLLDPDRYLPSELAKAWYKEKLGYLARANLLLAISQSSANETIKLLGVDRNRVKNISCATDGFFSAVDLTSQDTVRVTRRYGISRKYLMHSGAFELRKNFEGLIRAFAKLPRLVRREYQLVLVCSLDQPSRRKLMALADEIGLAEGDLVLTNFVPDDDLRVLFAGCHLFVFPSFHEGFGLPALEAMSFGIPTIGSNATSVPEVIGRADALFDPSSLDEMTTLILKALTDNDFYCSLKAHAQVQAAKFNWDETAIRTITGLRELAAGNILPAAMETDVAKRKRMLERLAALGSQARLNDLDLLDLACKIERNHVAIGRLKASKTR